jgi:hypothetical protein
MKEWTQVFSELRIFSQNVNRNYGYMDSLLSSEDLDIYDLLFIQEPPWKHIATNGTLWVPPSMSMQTAY